MIPYWNNSALIHLFLKLDAIVNLTMTPSNPVYINNGSTARLVWDYSDPNNEIFATIFSVLVDGKKGKEFKRMLVKRNGVVQNHPDMPSAYKGRVSMEATATLVIEKVTPRDNTQYRRKLFDGTTNPESKIQLLVTGCCTRLLTHLFLTVLNTRQSKCTFLRAIFRENQKSQDTRKKIDFFFSFTKTSLLVT